MAIPGSTPGSAQGIIGVPGISQVQGKLPRAVLSLRIFSHPQYPCKSYHAECAPVKLPSFTWGSGFRLTLAVPALCTAFLSAASNALSLGGLSPCIYPLARWWHEGVSTYQLAVRNHALNTDVHVLGGGRVRTRESRAQKGAKEPLQLCHWLETW